MKSKEQADVHLARRMIASVLHREFGSWHSRFRSPLSISLGSLPVSESGTCPRNQRGKEQDIRIDGQGQCSQLWVCCKVRLRCFVAQRRLCATVCGRGCWIKKKAGDCIIEKRE